MSVRLGMSVGPFFISGGRRRRPTGKHARFGYAWYWLSGLFVIEGEAWILAGIFIGIWWLLWATAGAILYEAARFRPLPAWWGRVMDSTRPVWPKRKPAVIATRPAVLR